MKHDELAGKLFRDGYNCSQAVLLAFSDLTGLDEKTAIQISAGLGGGMSRLREACGAVSGAFLVAGLLWAPNEVWKTGEKAAHYATMQDFANRFKAENGSIICRELLGLEKGKVDLPTPEERTADYYKRRPCEEYIKCAARILDEMIEERK